MKEKFRAYYKPTNDELNTIWNNGIIVLDTNTLLNFFRYTPGTREQFLEVLDKLQESLWIPHHVGLEFHRRRLGVISATFEAFSKVSQSLREANNTISGVLNQYRHHPSLNKTEISDEIAVFFDQLQEKINKKKANHEKNSENGQIDIIYQRITELFYKRVGTKFDDQQMAEIYREGEDRYENEIPPGFKDRNKSDSNQYGDLIIWKEMLNRGAETKKPIIFVTDDAKEDWWWKHKGEVQGPRVELIEEYWDKAEARVHFYEPLRFLEYAREKTNTEVSDASLEEVDEVSSSNRYAYQLVLLEKKKQLENEHDRLHQIYQNLRSRGPDPSQRQDLQDELRNLSQRQSEVQNRISELLSQVELSSATWNSSKAQSQMSIAEATGMQEQLAHLQGDMYQLQQRRDYIKRKLYDKDEFNQDESSALKIRIAQVQDELRKIDQAMHGPGL